MIDFKGHRFGKDISLVCVRWYVAYPLSYRNLEEMMAERGVQVRALKNRAHEPRKAEGGHLEGC
jgi:transposase-like protein